MGFSSKSNLNKGDVSLLLTEYDSVRNLLIKELGIPIALLFKDLLNGFGVLLLSEAEEFCVLSVRISRTTRSFFIVGVMDMDLLLEGGVLRKTNRKNI